MAENTQNKIFGFTVPKTAIYDIAAFFYLSLLIILSMSSGFSWLTYSMFIAVATIIILPRPQTGLALIIILTIVFERFFTLQALIIDQQSYKFYPLDIIIILTVIGCFIQLFKNRLNRSKLRIQPLPFGWPEKLLIYFWIAMTVFFVKSLFDINSSLDLAFSAFKNYAFYGLLYFLTIYLSRTAGNFKKNVHLFLIGGLAVIFFILYGIINGQGLWTEFTPLSTGGVRLLAGTHAFYLLLATIIGLALMAGKKFTNNHLPALILIIWSIGIIGSLMRHLWLAAILGIFILILTLNFRENKIIKNYLTKIALTTASMVIIIILGTALFPNNSLAEIIQPSISNLEQRAMSLTNASADSSVSWRYDFWGSAIKAWKASPVIGIGLGHQIVIDSAGWQSLQEVRNIHNSLLAIIIQTGILGFIIFIAFIASVVSATWQKLKSHPLSPYLAGLTACLFILLFASLFEPYLETNLTGIFLWIILGLMRAGEQLIKKSDIIMPVAPVALD